MYSKLSNNIKMPLIGLGTYLLDNKKIEKLAAEAIKIGYRHFDTAQMYDNSIGLGKAISHSKIPRKDFFITSKQWGHYTFEIAKIKFMETLSMLKTDYIDLYLIHWPSHDSKINSQTWKFFEWLYNNKYCRAIGVSNFSRYQLQELLKTCKIKPMVNQVEFHPGLNQIPLRKYLSDNNIRMISYGPMMRGGIYREPLHDKLKIVADKYKITIAQLVISWGINQEIFMIPKTQNKSRLKENFSSLNIKINKDDLETINNMNLGKRLYSDPSNNPYGNFIK